ncbi:MAG: hypothetical protein ACREQA_20660 [Candidatus Binatia bacterium]
MKWLAAVLVAVFLGIIASSDKADANHSWYGGPDTSVVSVYGYAWGSAPSNSVIVRIYIWDGVLEEEYYVDYRSTKPTWCGFCPFGAFHILEHRGYIHYVAVYTILNHIAAASIK